ncbi:Tetratricopeptide repeat-containing protein [Psychrobacillus psychrotolerans]|uniref:Tetratricopeptide repeat-containing protein n=1 Tax=Psychrobacillus psychrotolerans TaxID=126156 RepID=A0A1I5VW11_9BACI|nr:tetratricopeptide repeat protein [Psychrobacillus psychrotolerans]SFQ11593.1 Tetratricopeptide repeat-containing protein [Psychrobacillus psychrotolerans]
MDNFTPFIHAMEEGNIEKISTMLESFLLNGDPDEQYQLADLLTQSGFLQEAISILEHLQFLFPEENQLKIDQAQLYLEMDKEDEALEMLTTIEKTSDAYPQALLTLADYYQMLGLYEVAEQKINEALTLLPKEPLLLYAKGELLFETGRYLEAARVMEDLLPHQESLQAIDLSLKLAEIYSAGAAYEEAIPYYALALEKEVAPDVLFHAAYASFQVQQYETAAKQLEDLLQIDPDYFSGYMLLAETYAMLEKNEDALKAITDGIARDEFEKEYYLFAGKISLKLGKVKEAETFLREAIALDPEYMDAIFILSSLYSTEEKDEELVELYETLKQEHFEWSAMYPFLATAYERLELYEKAYEFYQLAYTEHIEDVPFLEKYVYFLLEEGKRAEAKEVVLILQKLQPENSEWFEMFE